MFKTGKLAPRRNLFTQRTATALALSFNELPPPPDNSPDWMAAVLQQAPLMPGYDPKYPLGMFGNDQWGDCVIADGYAHMTMVHTANTGTMVVPIMAVVTAMYEILCPGFDPDTGDNDNGCNETDLEMYLIKIGVSAGQADIDPANFIHQRWAINLYGGINYGIQVPDYMEDYYDAGKVLDVIAGKPMNFEGGHDINGVDYVKDGQTTLYKINTWGREMLATEAFMAACMDECHVRLSNAWDRHLTTQVAPSGYDDAVLQAALGQAIALHATAVV